LINSSLLSALSGGIGKRIRLPSFEGFKPKFDSWIDLITLSKIDTSQTWTVKRVGCGAEIFPTSESLILEPYASTEIFSIKAGLALPALIPAISTLK